MAVPKKKLSKSRTTIKYNTRTKKAIQFKCLNYCFICKKWTLRHIKCHSSKSKI